MIMFALSHTTQSSSLVITLLSLRSLWSWMTIWKSKRSEDERRRGWVKNSEKLVAHFAICIEELYEAQQRWRREDDDESDSSGWAERNEICLKILFFFLAAALCFLCVRNLLLFAWNESHHRVSSANANNMTLTLSLRFSPLGVCAIIKKASHKPQVHSSRLFMEELRCCLRDTAAL